MLQAIVDSDKDDVGNTRSAATPVSTKVTSNRGFNRKMSRQKNKKRWMRHSHGFLKRVQAASFQKKSVASSIIANATFECDTTKYSVAMYSNKSGGLTKVMK